MANESGRYVKDVEAARILSLSPQHLRNMRSQNRGPSYVKLGAWSTRYKVADLEAWAEAGKVTPAG